MNRILSTNAPREALSDLVRLELLHRYGGVWGDATTVCAKPLDGWLNQYARHGFFAFDRPGPDRMISTWFLAAHKGSYIVERWRDAAARYWRDRIERDEIVAGYIIFSSEFTKQTNISSPYGTEYRNYRPCISFILAPTHRRFSIHPPRRTMRVSSRRPCLSLSLPTS